MTDIEDYEDAIDIKLYKVSLAESGTGVGKNWNLYYDMNSPAGTKLRITLNSYSGTLFTNMQVRFYRKSFHLLEIELIYRNQFEKYTFRKRMVKKTIGNTNDT